MYFRIKIHDLRVSRAEDSQVCSFYNLNQSGPRFIAFPTITNHSHINTRQYFVHITRTAQSVNRFSQFCFLIDCRYVFLTSASFLSVDWWCYILLVCFCWNTPFVIFNTSAWFNVSIHSSLVIMDFWGPAKKSIKTRFRHDGMQRITWNRDSEGGPS